MADLLDRVRRLLVGRPMRTDALGHTLLPKRIALPVFASDALSSVAYAPDEILLTLSLAGMAAMTMSIWVGLGVITVLVVVVISYRQTVHAYPSGGGDYEVATTNLGPRFGLVVASALLVDYIMTVAVSISSGAHYLATAVPSLAGYEAPLAAGTVVALMILNLRGVKESGTAFAIPTYVYMGAIGLMVAVGLFQLFTGNLGEAATAKYEVAPVADYSQGLIGLAGGLLILRAFSSGCAALTGVEAISNGVPAFRKPKSRNAASTLALLGIISAAMVLSILYLAHKTKVRLVENSATQYLLDGKPVGKPVAQAPVIGQLAETIFRDARPLFLLVTVVTGLILVLAANTAFNGFPVLASVLSRDSFLPRQLYNRGDRLAYSNGIVVLAAAAVILILAFNASVTALIQLYIVGVFISFTTSQLGMIRHWNRLLRTQTDAAKRAKMKRTRVINVFGFFLTGLVLAIVLLTKFTHGAWIALLMMAVVYLAMNGINRHYQRINADVALEDIALERALPARVHAMVLVPRLHKPAMRAISYARATNPSSLEIVSVAVDQSDVAPLRLQWEQSGLSIPLTILTSPFRDVTGPVLRHVRSVRRRSPRELVVIFLPQYMVAHWWQQALHNQTALRLRTRLMFTPGVVIAAVPWQLGEAAGRAPSQIVAPETR